MYTIKEKLRFFAGLANPPLGTVPGQWGVLDRVRDNLRTGPLNVHAWNGSWTPNMAHINLEDRGLDGQGVRDPRATGFSVGVLVNLLRCPGTIQVIQDAVILIEGSRPMLDAFAFQCPGGTHRSVGCAVLLVLMVYTDGRVIPHTPRTQKAARDAGWVEAYY